MAGAGGATFLTQVSFVAQVDEFSSYYLDKKSNGHSVGGRKQDGQLRETSYGIGLYREAFFEIEQRHPLLHLHRLSLRRSVRFAFMGVPRVIGQSRRDSIPPAPDLPDDAVLPRLPVHPPLSAFALQLRGPCCFLL